MAGGIMGNNNYIWVFGENKANTACENSFHFWRYAVGINDNIDKYLILKRNNTTLKIYNNLSSYEKKFVIWHNSRKHRKIYDEIDMAFVGDDYEDIAYTKTSLGRPIKLKEDKATVFLQKDTSPFFKVPETGDSLNYNIFRYCVYDYNNISNFKEKNDFKDYQLYYAEYPFKFDDVFISKFKSNDSLNQILWVVEWRYYEDMIDEFVLNLIRILKSEKLNEYLKSNHLTLKLALHPFYKKSMFKEIYECENEYIEIFNIYELILNDEIINSKLLITDYSSLAYDFSLLHKPVFLYQPDFEKMTIKNQLYLDANILNEANIKDCDELIDAVIDENYSILDSLNNWDENIESNAHLEKAYNHFKDALMNKITFIGYNFLGTGGTVNATKALAEVLVNKGYLLEMYSIVKTKPKYIMPYGVTFTNDYDHATISIREQIKYSLFKLSKQYSYLKYEYNLERINPYSVYKLKQFLKNIRSNTVASTRESMHLFLDDCKSEAVKNKVYFFHAPADSIDIMYPGLIHKLKEKTFKKAIFVTESNRNKLKELFEFDNYDTFINIGNAIETSKIINRDDIKEVPKKDKYRGIYLLRISEDRKEDIGNLINFAKYLRDNDISNIVIDVFGSGNYSETLDDIIYKENLSNIVYPKGRTNNPAGEIRSHDFVCDFTLNHSFGMTYIEGVLNGRKVFCMKNPGSVEVMNDIPNSYIESFDWLVKEINNIDKISLEELQSNYDNILSKYSQEAVCEKFLNFLD